MNLSEIVQASLAQHFCAAFDGEIAIGEANRADFQGHCAWLGSVRVELERRREDPVNNVIKAWRQAETSQHQDGFTLVQIFSGFYATRRSKRENAKFAGAKMQEWASFRGLNVRYIAVDIDFEPPAGDANLAVQKGDEVKICEQILSRLQARCPAPA